MHVYSSRQGELVTPQMKKEPTDHSAHVTEMLMGEQGADLMLRLFPLLHRLQSNQQNNTSKIIPAKHPGFPHLSAG